MRNETTDYLKQWERQERLNNLGGIFFVLVLCITAIQGMDHLALFPGRTSTATGRLLSGTW